MNYYDINKSAVEHVRWLSSLHRTFTSFHLIFRCKNVHIFTAWYPLYSRVSVFQSYFIFRKLFLVLPWLRMLNVILKVAKHWSLPFLWSPDGCSSLFSLCFQFLLKENVCPARTAMIKKTASSIVSIFVHAWFYKPCLFVSSHRNPNFAEVIL